MGPAEAIVVLVLLLFGPLIARGIEENLEAYCFLLGILAIALAGGADRTIITKALADPIPITLAVIIAGVLFQYGREHLDRAVDSMTGRMSRPLLAALIVAVIALLSSIITSIIAALMLVEALRSLRLPREKSVQITVAGCLAIGLGASLTPVGEPLSTIAVDALNLDFFGLTLLLAPFVLPGIAACSALAAFCARGDYAHDNSLALTANGSVSESVAIVIFRGVKVFAFIAGLVLLGEAFAPLAEKYVADLNAPALYWANVVGAALDNATVIAIEIHGMELTLAREVILALLASGGMLIQGNIPNIIAAGALRISAAQWARYGIPMGLVLLVVYFVSLRLI